MNPKLLTLLVVTLSIVEAIKIYGHWTAKMNRVPKFMGDKIPYRALDTNRRKVQQKIVIYHNHFRSKVRPSAANMLKMNWHREAAKDAKRWADKCKFLTHDPPSERYVDKYGSCGQNIFVATQKVPWMYAIRSWWLEKEQFKYGRMPNNSAVIGHYTQMVWAASHEVGCGISKCFNDRANVTSVWKVYYNYVCNYCPSGNHRSRLAFPYRKGGTCALCRNSCRRNLCTNSCPASNFWGNCRQLFKAHPYWLCHSSHTAQGRERFAKCRATCTCRGKIHD